MLREAARFCQMLARFCALGTLVYALMLFCEHTAEFTGGEMALWGLGIAILFAVQGSWGKV